MKPFALVEVAEVVAFAILEPYFTLFGSSFPPPFTVNVTFAAPSETSLPVYWYVLSPLTVTLVGAGFVRQESPSTVNAVNSTSSDKPSTVRVSLSSLNFSGLASGAALADVEVPIPSQKLFSPALPVVFKYSMVKLLSPFFTVKPIAPIKAGDGVLVLVEGDVNPKTLPTPETV